MRSHASWHKVYLIVSLVLILALNIVFIFGDFGSLGEDPCETESPFMKPSTQGSDYVYFRGTVTEIYLPNEDTDISDPDPDTFSTVTEVSYNRNVKRTDAYVVLEWNGESQMFYLEESVLNSYSLYHGFWKMKLGDTMRLRCLMEDKEIMSAEEITAYWDPQAETDNRPWTKNIPVPVLYVLSYAVPTGILVFFLANLYVLIKRLRKESDGSIFLSIFACTFITANMIIVTFIFYQAVKDPYKEKVDAHAPIIYIYNEYDDDTPVTVTLDIDGDFTYINPGFDIDNGWTVTATPDGTLTAADGREYPFLFWEAALNMDYELGYGYCVPGDETEAFLYDAMDRLGLSESEAAAFVGYWLPYMEENPYNVINFQTDAYEDCAGFNVSPSPDVVVRVNMLWYSSEEYVEVNEQSLEDMNPGVDERHGLTVVEWGGERIEVR